MDNFSTFASLNNCNLVSGSKCLVIVQWVSMDSTMALEDHYDFKYVHGSNI